MTTSAPVTVDAARETAPSVHVGFDVGGTKIFGVATDSAGALEHTLREPTPVGADALVARLADMAARLSPQSPPASVGVGMAGLITLDGRVTVSPNLSGVDGADIGTRLSNELAVPVALDNEVNCAARWELASGAARGCRHAVMVAIGTGIGGASMIDGRVLRGGAGLAGEPGHMVVVAGGRKCACGRRGCWEAYASGTALDRLAAERLGTGVRGPDVTAAARRGDAGAQAVLAEFAYWLALGISNLCMLTDPELVVMGGGLSEDWDLLADAVDAELAKLLIGRSAASRPKVVRSEAGELASALGAALGGASAGSAADAGQAASARGQWDPAS